MKKETRIIIKRKIAMVLVFIIVLQLCRVQPTVLHAEDRYLIEVNVVDGETEVLAGKVSVKLSGEDEWEELVEEEGTYQGEISSENVVPGSYMVCIEADGYEYYEESVSFVKDGDYKLTATVNIGDKNCL